MEGKASGVLGVSILVALARLCASEISCLILMIQMGILLSPMMLLRMILFKLRRKVKWMILILRKLLYEFYVSHKVNCLKRRITNVGACNVKRKRSSDFPVANTFTRYFGKFLSTLSNLGSRVQLSSRIGVEGRGFWNLRFQGN
uniref:Uncharacterized protein n=1 Tax=Aegilops tauschii subsp. strangulata TaxID=200361 RepID=A0A453LFX4_AEGTS